MNCRRISSLTFSELKAQFVSPVIYIFLIAFWILHGFFTMRASNFFDSNTASIEGAMFWHPWLWLILVPAVGMHLWADEKRDGTIELLFTLPMTVTEAVIAKFKSAYTILLLALLGTAPLIITIYYLGSPDCGPIVSGYIGSALLAGASLSITCLMSSLTRSHVVGFILSLVALFLLTLSGWDMVLKIMCDANFPNWILDTSAAISTMTHFSNFQKGLIELKDVVYFISVASLFIFFTINVLDTRWRWKQRLPMAMIGLILCVAVNIIVGFFPMKMDLTENKIYTLSPAAQNILKKISPERPVSLTLYFSETHPDLSPAFRVFANRIWTFMQEIAETNPNIKIEKVNPIPDTESEDIARASGIQGTQTLSGEFVYLGVGIKCIDQTMALPTLMPELESQFEYAMVSAITQISRESKPEIALLSSFPLIQQPQRNARGQMEDASWIAFKELEKNYKINYAYNGLDIQKLTIEKTPTLIVVHPQNLDMNAQYAIDQYLLRGGNLMIGVDPAPIALVPEKEGDVPNPSSFEPFLKNHGIFLTSSPIADAKFSPIHPQVGGTMISNISLRDEAISRELNASKNIRELMFFTPGGVRATPAIDSAYTIQSLITTSDTAFEYRKSYILQNRPMNLTSIDKRYTSKFNLSILLNGNFNTAFADSAQAQNGLLKSSTPAKMVIFSDIDFLCNQAIVQVQQTPFGNMISPINDNLFFFQNMIDLMCGDQDLISIRVKELTQRPLTVIDEMRRVAAEKSQAQIAQYEEKLNKVRQEISALQSPQTGKVILTAETQAKLKTLETERKEINSELKKQRRAVRADIDSLQNRIELINILLLPLLIGFFATIFLIYRSRKCGAL